MAELLPPDLDAVLPSPETRRARDNDRTRFIEELACDFIEEEIGRHDWLNNWEQVKNRRNIESMVFWWLERIGAEDVTAGEIVDYIDKFVEEHGHGRWH